MPSPSSKQGSTGLQVLEGSLTAGLSNTVCISDPEGEWPFVQDSVVKELSEFGEIARLDTSLSVVLKCILLTFFDVRSSQRLLLHMADRSEPFPPAAHDCRIVRVKMASFVERLPMVAATGGFAQFGEVAHIAMCGGDALVEYYDMRAAQMLLVAAGLTASPWMLASPGQQSSALGVFGACGAPGLEGLGLTVAGMLGGSEIPASIPTASPTATAAKVSTGSVSCSQPALSPLAIAALAAEEGKLKGGSGLEASASPTANPAGAAVTAPEAAKTEPRVGSRPVRTKVTTKEFSKYDIDPDKIQRCEDPRTTVMVRNLMGNHARKDFLRFLERCGLQDRYTFFYMPCKEHRSIPAGFAFVNFAAPSDVHKLYVMVKSGFWREFMTDAQSKAPAMSYARFQGHEELTKHFNSSAVLHEQDPDKRPIFRLEVMKQAAKERSISKESTGATGSPKHVPEEHSPKEEGGTGATTGSGPMTVQVESHLYGPMMDMAFDSASPKANTAVDLHLALEKGAQEIAAILMRKPAQAHATQAENISPQTAEAAPGLELVAGKTFESPQILAKGGKLEDEDPMHIATEGLGA